MSITASVATPQAARTLRVGSRGMARAFAAKMGGKPVPDEKSDDDEDEREEDSATGEADASALNACADACETAAEACGAAGEQLTTQAKELRAGTDSISSLTATDEACETLDGAIDDCRAAIATLRGVPAPADSDAPPPPEASDADGEQGIPPKMLASLAAPGTTEARLEGAQLQAFALHTLDRLGLSAGDVVKARGVLGGKLDLAARAGAALKSEAKTAAAAWVAEREKLWETSTTDGRHRLKAVFDVIDGPNDAAGQPTTQRVYTKWASAQNALYPQPAAFRAWIESVPPEPGARNEHSPSTALADQGAAKRERAVLDERSRDEARRAGIDPDLLAQQMQITTRGAPSAAGERA